MSDPAPNRSQSLNLRLDYRLVAIALLVVIAVMLLLWKPWQPNTASGRTVEVSGQATVSAKPDKFVFYPSYEFKNANKQDALDQLAVKNNEIIAKLKTLGVTDKDIKSNADSWSYPIYKDGTDATPTYSLQLTVTTNESLSQKVQDYLVSTTPSGSVTPQATFSEATRKKLENEARDTASKDARVKAELSAKNLGFKVAAVKTVKDGAGFGSINYPLDDKAIMTMEANSSRSSLTLQPGENDLTYTVTVTYFIR